MSGTVPGGEARGWHEPRRGTRGPTRAHPRLTVRHPCEPQIDQQEEDQVDQGQRDPSQPRPDGGPTAPPAGPSQPTPPTQPAE
ncbi:hypothetical protein F4556_005158 [Kitasatospora gansuensis]|uniref:Uncharacterized protein n=1 Tax=Kitasatospora gansuensis TaxID=258050 RepID=A0A7W7SFQ3_9ACTN|nr:hypothetical protein [Kitasatospora gansuensis]MBB4949623.1 hypothetical protein [Kitasatospora gansuensis]